MSGGSNNGQDVDIDLGQLVRAVWDRKLMVLATTCLAAALAFGVASAIAPSYRSEARILIEQRTPAFAQSDSLSGANQSLLDEQNIASQVQVLQSVDLIKQVARDMKLYDRREFDPTSSPSAVSTLLVTLGLKRNPLETAPEERVIKAFMERLQVYQVEKSRVIGVQFTSEDPALAAAVPNAMAQVYETLQSGAKLDSNSDAARWLEPEIANLREKVEAAERKVADYRSSADLLPTGDQSTFAVRQLNDISAELARLRGEKANTDARAENVRAVLASGRPGDTLGDVVGSQMVQRLKETESSVQGQIADLSTTLLENHPRLKGLRAQLAGIRGQIQQETRKILASLENDAKVAELRERQLVQQLNRLKADTARAGEEEVGLKALEREATAQRQLLETYLGRYREASSRADSNSSPADARIISRAVEPREAYFPKVMPITVVVALGTLVLFCVIIMLIELFSGRALRAVGPSAAPVAVARREETAAGAARSGQSAANLLSAPADEALAREMADAAFGSDFSIAAVGEHLVDNDIRLSIVISPTGDEGSAATVMLARDLADAGRRVVLLDMTGSAYPTRLMAEFPDLPGITDLLDGEAAYGDTIHPDRHSDAHIVPYGTSDVRRAMRGAERLSMILDALAGAYDHVLVECGPADVAGVARLTRNRDAAIILSVPDPREDVLLEAIAAFEKAGYPDLVLMSDPQRHPAPRMSAQAAA